MDALRRSVQGERQATAQPKQSPAQPKKGRKRIEGQREMLLPIEGKQSAREPAKEGQGQPRGRCGGGPPRRQETLEPIAQGDSGLLSVGRAPYTAPPVSTGPSRHR